MLESIALTRSRHQFGWGGSLHVVHLGSRLANRFGGIFLFPTLERFLEARPDVYVQAFGDPSTRISTTPVGAWVKDRWQPAAGLTVEAGVRCDYQWMPAPFTNPSRNVAPRLGVAWKPQDAPFVVRAALGLFYDRYPLAFLNEAIQKDGSRGFEQYVVGNDAVRALSHSRGGTLSGPLPWAPRTVYSADGDWSATYSRKLTVGFEQGIGKNTTVFVEQNWVRGLHLPRIRNAALTLPPLYQLEQAARSSYRGLSLTVNRRMNRELAFLAAYNLGRTWDDASDFDEHPLDPSNTRKDWARSRQHQAQRLAASALFELPAEEVPGLPEWLRDTLEHVVVAAIVTVNSGRPVNALASTDLFRTGAYPISARPFDIPRNPYLSRSTFSADLRAMKGFPVRNGRGILQVGVEAFNLTNHSNPLRVSEFYSAEQQRLASYGRPIESLNARQLQFVIQVEY